MSLHQLLLAQHLTVCFLKPRATEGCPPLGTGIRVKWPWEVGYVVLAAPPRPHWIGDWTGALATPAPSLSLPSKHSAEPQNCMGACEEVGIAGQREKSENRHPGRGVAHSSHSDFVQLQTPTGLTGPWVTQCYLSPFPHVLLSASAPGKREIGYPWATPGPSNPYKKVRRQEAGGDSLFWSHRWGTCPLLPIGPSPLTGTLARCSPRRQPQGRYQNGPVRVEEDLVSGQGEANTRPSRWQAG